MSGGCTRGAPAPLTTQPITRKQNFPPMSGGSAHLAPAPLNPTTNTWKETPSTYERRLRPNRASPTPHQTDYMEGDTYHFWTAAAPQSRQPRSTNQDMEGNTFPS